MKVHLAQIAILFLTLCVFPLDAQESRSTEFRVAYNSSGLTVITVSDGNLECTYHTDRKDERRPRLPVQSFAPFDTHVSRISLTDAELKELREWAGAAVKTKATEEQMRDRNGYHTVLEIRMDGNRYSPDHATAGGLWALVKRIIADRTKAALQ
jgi:hypothetical protein